MLIDDDRATCDMITMVMSYNNVDLQIAHDAESALEVLDAQQPDVIILDIFLPGMDGYRALKQIRTRKSGARATVIATTAYYTPDTPNEVINWGFNGYLPKPFDPTKVLNYVNDTIRKK
jgi:DNA-binding response OmpR family regulator